MDYFLTIAASDTSGGAGIQQDIKVAHNLGYWALSALTGITVQNFQHVFEIQAVSPTLLSSQIEQCLLSFPLKAIKIGAICSEENIQVITNCLKKYPQKHVVLDPVLASTGGEPFLNHSSLSVLQKELFPLTELITPNKPELELLSNNSIHTLDDAIEIAKEKSAEWNTTILLKGGHYSGEKIKEALVTPTNIICFQRDRKEFTYSHGTGCTLSSALACYLGKGETMSNAYKLASKLVIDFYSNMSQKLFIKPIN